MNLKCLNNIMAYAALTVLGACSQNDMPAYNIPGEDDNSFTVSASLNVPLLGQAQTRSLGQTPEYSNLKLYAIEFECVNADDPSQNVILNIYDNKDEISNEQFDGNDIVTFNIRLNKSEHPRILHLVAVPKGVDLEIGYGTEAYVIPNLYTTGNNDAYWKRIVFTDGYGVQGDSEWQTSDDAKRLLTNVPMLRNFAQISVANEADNFVLTGFTVMNIADRGSVAPWNYSKGEFAEFLNGSEMKSYSEISSEEGEGYPGYLPGGYSLTDLSAEGMTFDTDPKYIYERPFPQTHLDRTFVIVSGRYGNDQTDTYYKVDLGKSEENGVFSYYNLLRNINYHITINKVGVSGYPTPSEAATGVVYNNFSFDVDTQRLTNISDGSDILFVNFTSAVITRQDQTAIEFKYRYRKVGNSTDYNNDNLNFIGLEPGSVIESVSTPSEDDKSGWRTVKIKTFNPTNDVKTQSFTLVDPTTGLGRTITLILRNPWQLLNPEEFAGRFSWTYPTEAQATVRRGKAGYTTGRYLTVFFNLPDELNEAMFPLTFTVESDRQDIENDPIGNLLVTSGPSMFVSGATRIQYLKTVTWRQYNEEKTKENPNNTIVESDGRKIHRVRCRFLTTTSVPSGTLTTNVKIRNPYFDDIQVSFLRETGRNFPEIEEQ